jgi:predicted alpha/beta-fold hydrolase
MRSLKILKKLINYFEFFLKSIKIRSKNYLLFSLISGIIFLIYRKSFICNKTYLFYKKTLENKKIFNSMKPYNYSPAILMPYPIIQIILHESIMTPKRSLFKREYIKSYDEGEYSLDWVVEDPRDFTEIKNKKIMLILHGLTGGSQTIYMRDIIDGYKKLKDFKICVLHSRGINDTPLKTPKSMHVSFTMDLDHCIKMLKKRFPEIPLYTTGVSMGANILTKYLSNEYDMENMNNYIKCFISISNPFDFFELRKKVEKSILPYFLRNNIYSYFNLNRILRNIEGNKYKKIYNNDNDKDKDNDNYNYNIFIYLFLFNI